MLSFVLFVFMCFFVKYNRKQLQVVEERLSGTCVKVFLQQAL